MKKIITLSLFLLLVGESKISAQSLLDSLDNMVAQTGQTEYAEATFKAPRLINGQTVELIGKNELGITISHRFGSINEGAYNFYGLTESKIRLGLDYGLIDKINLGFGISSYQRTFDGILKINLLRQSSGQRNIPFTVVFTSTAYISAQKVDTSRHNLFSSKLFYSHQLQIARKFGNRISLQLTPGIVHRNLVKREIDQNNVYSLGIGGRFKITNRLAITSEYYYLLPGQTAKDFVNSFSLGFDIETGGHVFQLLFTNSLAPQEFVFIPETNSKWVNKDIHFGFNIIRTIGFSQKNKK